MPKKIGKGLANNKRIVANKAGLVSRIDDFAAGATPLQGRIYLIKLIIKD